MEESRKMAKLAYEALDEKKGEDIKIIDIISPTIKYINNSSFLNIGLMGTTKTIESKIFPNSINKNI